MGDFKRNNRSNNRGSRGRSGRRGSRDREMFDAVCDNCGKDCKVPFKPSGDKPIYCSECFDKKGGNDRRRSGGRNSGRGRSNGSEKAITELSKKIKNLDEKLDKVISMLSEDSAASEE